ncbi:putative competence/damage-inducible CinA family protein [Microdochium trichocladiopsis]|uniref:Competence/damage-inducible CinA family protein n=1 Tax=Microdochium trichocladiopsis TaxID=1682393 RepID=A0A9P9BNX0_9PEZI|nr:putative competence/damage-inducible CinA family protein [Microdochium trichocladiopsis]KAH7021298.1 putative competence/damage-inducible CinA family protein [Microdochium trichocladiopsis]
MVGPKEFPPLRVRALAAEVVALLKLRKETVSVAETAAGGIISASLLAQPGASKVFKGGLTLYTLESRVAFAGWTQADIDAYRGPTPQVVQGLAENVRARLGSTYTVCESGTAGPTGGNTPNRTPGYVALAVASAATTDPSGGEAVVDTKEISNTGNGTDREANMISFAEEALRFLLQVITGVGSAPVPAGSGGSAL